MSNDIVSNLVEVKLKNDEDFLKIRETLTRIGVASRKDNTLTQSCHILHKRGNFYIVHFKELFLLDGKQSNLDQTDIGRRNTIVNLLSQWGLVEVVKPDQIKEPITPLNQIKVVAYKDKHDWKLVAKYTIGRAKHESQNR